MNITRCDDFLKQLKLGSEISLELTRTLVPDLCKTIPNKNGSFQERYFHYVCCHSPRPTVKQSKYEIVQAVCTYLYHLSNRTSGEEDFLRGNCQTQSISEDQELRIAVWLCIVLALLAILGFGFNALLIFTFNKCKHLQKTATHFMTHLAVTNIFTIFQMIFFLVCFNNKELTIDRVKTCLLSSLDIFSASASLLLIAAVSMERAAAILYPADHNMFISHINVIKLVRFIWTSAFSAFVLALLRIWIRNNLYHNFIFYMAVGFSFILPIAVTASSHSIVIFYTAKKCFNRDTISNMTRYREIKQAYEVCFFTLPTLISWGYFAIMNVHEVLQNKTSEGLLRWFIVLLPYLTSCLNPILYVTIMKTIRANALKLVKQRCRCCQAKEIEIPTQQDSIEGADGVYILSDCDDEI